MAAQKQLIVFDLDGTLVRSKSPMEQEMVLLMRDLLEQKQVAIISGSPFTFFEKNVVNPLPESANFQNLLLFPTTAARLYRFEHPTWNEVYAELLEDHEWESVRDAFGRAFSKTGYTHPAQTWGDIVEHRGTQVSFSALGQVAPVEEKEKLRAKWNTEGDPRIPIVEELEKELTNFEIRIAGLTTIDVTRKGIDKAYGIQKIEEHTGMPRERMLFIGDELRPRGNDYPVIGTGVECIETDGLERTKEIIRKILIP